MGTCWKIAVALNKGGVGKTTTTAAEGEQLAASGARVLLVDLDPQGNLSQALGYDPESLETTVYDLLLHPAADAHAAVLHTPYGPDLIGANLLLDGAEFQLATAFGRELLLKQALTPLLPSYDYVLLDCPRNLGVLAVNALAFADTVLVPLQAESYALGALALLDATITRVQQINATLHIGGILITQVDAQTKLCQAVEKRARDRYGDLVFRTVIPRNIQVAEAPAARQPITVYDPKSSGARAYRAAAQEARERWPVRT